MAVAQRDIVAGATRFLALSPEAQEEARTSTPQPLFERIEAEAAAINWVLAACLIWNEQGVLDLVLDHIRKQTGLVAP